MHKDCKLNGSESASVWRNRKWRSKKLRGKKNQNEAESGSDVQTICTVYQWSNKDLQQYKLRGHMEEEVTAKCSGLLITKDLFQRSLWQWPVLHRLLVSLQVQIKCRFFVVFLFFLLPDQYFHPKTEFDSAKRSWLLSPWVWISATLSIHREIPHFSQHRGVWMEVLGWDIERSLE